MQEFNLKEHQKDVKTLFNAVFADAPFFKIAAELMGMRIIIHTELTIPSDFSSRVVYYEVVFSHQGTNWNHIYLKNYSQMHAEIILFNLIKETIKHKKAISS